MPELEKANVTITPDAPEAKADDWKAPATQEELNSIIEKRLARANAKYADYDDVKAKAEKFDQAQNEGKTEVQREKERAEKAEADLAALQSTSLRSEVALVKGLTPTQAKRLVGTTREELEADADELLTDLAAVKKPGPVVPSAGDAPHGSSATPSINDLLRAAAQK